MKISILTNRQVPESWEEFQLLSRIPSAVQNLACTNCGVKFTPQNTQSSAGWRETQISGFCENCFDEIFGIEEDEESENFRLDQVERKRGDEQPD